MSDFKCPECGAPKDKIRYVQTCVEYHWIDEVHEDGVDLGGVDESYPDDNYWFDCQECEHTWGPGATPPSYANGTMIPNCS